MRRTTTACGGRIISSSTRGWRSTGSSRKRRNHATTSAALSSFPEEDEEKNHKSVIWTAGLTHIFSSWSTTDSTSTAPSCQPSLSDQKNKSGSPHHLETPPLSSSSLSSSSSAGMDYVEGWAWQQCILARRLAWRHHHHHQHHQPRDPPSHAATAASDSLPRDGQVLLLLEHEPVYTLGRGAHEEHVLHWHHSPPPPSPGDVVTTTTSAPTKKPVHTVPRLNLNPCSLPTWPAVLQSWSDPTPAVDPEDPAGWIQDLVPTVQAMTRHIHHHHQQAPAVRLPQSPAATHPSATTSIPLYRVERGGEVTFHGPGQLVVYPIMDLLPPGTGAARPGGDLHRYVYQLEQAVMDLLRHEYDLPSRRDDGHRGVWVGRDKVAAVGVAASRWMTTHGLALNVQVPHLDQVVAAIRPCGIASAEQRGVTSLDLLLQQHHPWTYNNNDKSARPTVPQVARQLVQQLQQQWHMVVDPGDHPDMLPIRPLPRITKSH